MPPLLEMYAFVVIDDKKENGEGAILSYETEWGAVPMVGGDIDRLRSLIEIADKIAQKNNISYKILHFKNPIDITNRITGFLKEEKGGGNGKSVQEE